MANPLYRAIYEQIRTQFPDRSVWSIKDICDFEGITYATANARYGRPGKEGFTAAAYAQMVAARQWSVLSRGMKSMVREANNG